MATFLGSNIQDFSINGGFNSETNIDINLADCFGSSGFNPPPVGTPTLFEYESFEFYGIVDTYRRDHGSAGNPIYSVQLNNGAHVLSGVELILNDYYGAVNVPNLFNIFGYLEYTGGFGGSNVNNAGISWASIVTALNAMTSSPSGTSYGGPIVLYGYKYKIDLSNLPNIPSYYRINSDNINLIDFIADICLAGGCDYFIDLQKPTNIEATAGWSGTFVIQTISRTDEPDVGKIQEFVDSTNCISAKNYGLELRKDVNSKFVVGANVERMYFNYVQNTGDNSMDGSGITEDEYGNDTILPFFGTDNDGNVIIGYTPSGESDEYYFDIDISDIKTPLNTQTYTTCLGELRAAKKGKESWSRFLSERNCNEYLIDPDGTSVEPFKVTWGASGFLEETHPEFGDLYGVPKYGYCFLGQKYGWAAAAATYASTPVDQRIIKYPTSYVPNLYYQRAATLKILSGREISFCRMFEYDLYDGAQVDPRLPIAYQTFKETLGIDDWADSYLNGIVSDFGSRKNDIDAGNLSDNATNQIYKRIKDLADNYYNKRFMISIPYTAAVIEPESTKIRMSQEVIPEGFIDESAWSTAYDSGLIPDISGINTLLSPDYKFYPFVKLNNAAIVDSSGQVDSVLYDLSEISTSDKIYSSPEASGAFSIYDCWIKCSVFEKIYFQDNQTLYGPRAVIELPGPIKHYHDSATYTKALMDAYSLSKQSGGAFENDATVTEAFFKKQLDKLGGDDQIFHDGEDIVYADLYAIPLRSKLLSYGPWYAVGASGKVSYERNLDLNPWNYGGFDAMNQAGLARVTDGITNQTFSEVGSVTVAGAPSFNFGQQIIAGGPYITSISCNFGDGGVQTTYSFQAWSSHRTLSKLNGFAIERSKNMRKTMADMRSNFREGLRSGKFKNPTDFYNKISNRIIDLNEYSRRDRSSTSHKMIGGQINGANSTVAIQPIYNAGAQSYTDYENKAFMSLDGIFSPFSTVEKSGWPSFEKINDRNPDDIDVYTLNPLQSGHNIQAISYGTGIDEFGLSSNHANELELQAGEDFLNYRGMAFRLPMIGAGWGYTTAGNPVPSGSGENGFRPDYLYNPDNWKCGPIEFRWDESRKVWVASGKEGVKHIRFTIVSVNDGSTSVYASYDAWDNGYLETDVPGDLNTLAGVPGRLGVVEIHDPNGCFFDEPSDELFARQGYAHYLLPNDAYGEPRWEVTSLCCRRLRCN